MGRGGKKKGGRGGGGRGGGGGRQRDSRPSDRNNDGYRSNKQEISRNNERFERYYNGLGILPDQEKEAFWAAMRRDLPNSFRFTGSRAHALAVQQRLRDYYIPEITSITYEGQYVDTPRPVEWYPDQLAWYMTTPKNVIRRFKPFASFQKFLVAETDVGNITRQEVVSMIPPLVMDLKPGMTVLDLCAAPGSKSAQLLEMIHAGEEERCRQVAESVAGGLNKPAGDDFADEGRSTGLLIANDVDYKRAHMLVHQMKRLASPNILVTNHDATVFPSIKIASPPSLDGRVVTNRYLKFDRILADVPCSGDGTVRKNMEIWKNWTPSNGLGLHATQVRILVRALQMLKVGGRVVYSTCSMNPVEDEAVLAEAIERCGGSDLVKILETKDLLPGLKRSPGLKQWSVMDKSGRIWNDYESIRRQKEDGDDALSRLSEGMFPPNNDLPLDRAMRVYPHTQDTGAFFIAILEKQSEIKAKPEATTAVGASNVKVDAADFSGTTTRLETAPNGQIPAVNGDAEIPTKRKREDGEEETTPLKRVKSEDTPATNVQSIDGTNDMPNATPNATQPTNSTAPSQPPAPMSSIPPKHQFPKKKSNNTPFEEPFKYLPSSLPALAEIRQFYNLSPRFPLSRFMVRNPDGTASKNIYYTSELTKEVLQENEGKGLKFVHAGVKMFVKQDAPSPDVCSWRIQTDGLRILEAWVGPERVVKLWRKETLRRLLIEMFPRFNGDDGIKLGEVGEQVREMGMGCCVLVVEPKSTSANGETDGKEAAAGDEGLQERMVLPLWKSHQSLNLMLPKEERKAMLLRLFNDDTPLVNMSKGWTEQQKKDGKGKKVEVNGEKTDSKESGGGDEPGGENALVDKLEEVVDARLKRNSSSPEPETEEPKDDAEQIVEVDGDEFFGGNGAASEDDEDGGMAIS